MTNEQHSHRIAGLTQLTKRRYEAKRVPRGHEPVFDCHLEDHEQIVDIEHYFQLDYKDRATVDHILVAWVAVRL